MPRTIVRALALGCVGVSISACNLTASQGQIDAGLTSGVTTPSGLSGIGLSPAQVTKITTVINDVRTATKTACGFLPTVTSVTSIIVALNPDVASVTVPVSQVASYACKALAGGIPTSYTAGEAPEKPAKKAPTKPAEPKVGDTLTRTIIVNGVPVTVTGTRTK